MAKFNIGEYGKKIQKIAREIKKLKPNITHRDAIKLAAAKIKKSKIIIFKFLLYYINIMSKIVIPKEELNLYNNLLKADDNIKNIYDKYVYLEDKRKAPSISFKSYANEFYSNVLEQLKNTNLHDIQKFLVIRDLFNRNSDVGEDKKFRSYLKDNKSTIINQYKRLVYPKTKFDITKSTEKDISSLIIILMAYSEKTDPLKTLIDDEELKTQTAEIKKSNLELDENWGNVEFDDKIITTTKVKGFIPTTTAERKQEKETKKEQNEILDESGLKNFLIN